MEELGATFSNVTMASEQQQLESRAAVEVSQVSCKLDQKLFKHAINFMYI